MVAGKHLFGHKMLKISQLNQINIVKCTNVYFNVYTAQFRPNSNILWSVSILQISVTD